MYSTDGNRAATSFDEWLNDAVQDPASREAKLTAWRTAPGGREAHPREEHLIPLMVAAGAAGSDPGARTFSGQIMGKALSGFQFG
jgi:aromatic ring-opening dioxygenase catalytic subunit (LigB family)